MSISLRTPAGLRDVQAISLRTPTGLRDVQEIWARTPTALRQIFSAFGGDSGLTASPTIVYGSTNSHAFQRINTGSTTVTVSPAGPVDSIGWTFDDTGWDAINPTSLTTAFRSPPVGPGDTVTVFATCTVTRGGVPASVDVQAECSNFGS